MLIKNLSIEWKRKNPKSRIIAIHPGTVDTPLSKPYQKNVKPEKLFSSDRAAIQILEILLNATPDQSGFLLSWNGNPIEP